MKRLLSIFLIIALSSGVLMACGENGDNVGDDTKAPSKNNEVAEESLRLDLDPALNFAGETFTIISYDDVMRGDNDENAWYIQRANYNQQMNTADRLGVEIEYVNVSGHTNLPGMVLQSVNSQSDDYQLVMGTAHTMLGLVTEGYFVPVSELPYVNYDKAWWNRAYAESVSINVNEPYVLFGDLNYNMVERTSAMLFNKELLIKYHSMDDNDLFDIVLDGEWTIDKFVELAEGVFEDDGDSDTANDIGDTHGITHMSYTDFEYVIYSAGVSLTARDEDGYPIFTDSPNEKIIRVVDKLLPIYKSQNTFHSGETGYGISDYANVKFAGGTALFLPNRLFVAGFDPIREMEDDFGIIPMPKYDESIDGYHSTVGQAVIWGLVPNTVSDLNMASAVVESLAYEGRNEVIPVYYEEALKLKYTRGDDIDKQSEILDLIRYGARTDFLYLNRMGGLGDVFMEIWKSGENNIASAWASKVGAAQTSLANTIAILERD